METNYRSVMNFEEIKLLLDGNCSITFDFETAPLDGYQEEPKAALDAHKSVIAGVSFSTMEGVAFYVPLNHRSGVNAERQGDLWQLMTERVFQNTQRVKIAHNLAFEAKFLYARGIVVQPPCYDTMLAAMLTLKAPMQFRKMYDSGLKHLAVTLFHADMPGFEEVTNGRHFDEMDPAEYETVRYACADSDYTLRLYHKINAWFDRNIPDHRFVAEQLESSAAVYVGMMKYNGILMDEPLMLEKQKECEEKIVECRNAINIITGGVNIGENAATKAFREYLYDTEALPVLNRTQKGMPAMDDEAMVLLKEWCGTHRPELAPLFDAVLEYRKWSKLQSTYVDGYLGYIHPLTGRIHPDLMQMKAG